LIAALWMNARTFGYQYPVMALALIGVAPSVIRWGDSMRAYGFGMLLIVLTMGAIWSYAKLPSPRRLLVATAMSVLSENLCNLVALASIEETAVDRMGPELQLEAILAFCRRNLHDTDLSPQRVADQLRMSVRTLHWRFKQTGQSFGRWVRENRLDGCAAVLRDPNQRSRNISDIAFNWGFNDLSHFNKAFRARFNMTPREWRNEGRA
jgi:AraC-like DNA-binding protein